MLSFFTRKRTNVNIFVKNVSYKLLHLVLENENLALENEELIISSIYYTLINPDHGVRLEPVLRCCPLVLTFPLVVKLIPRITIKEKDFFATDGATPDVAAKRRAALEALQKRWQSKFKQCLEFGETLKTLISDVRFTSGRCFPPFNNVMNQFLNPSMALAKTKGPEVVDIDGNAALDVSGTYGVNVCGYEQYKKFIDAGWAAAKDKGLYLGSLDETTLDNIKMIQQISGLAEVSFHMSGTEAVMTAVRCARFNQQKPLVVTFGVPSAAPTTAGGTACSRRQATSGRRRTCSA